MFSFSDRCILTQKADDGGPQQWALIVCNAIGSPIDSKYIDIEPKYVAVTQTHVIAANTSYFYAWNFQAEGDSPTRLLQKEKQIGRDVIRHIDDLEESGQGLAFKREVTDPIVAIAAREDIVVIARRAGTAYIFQLPAMKFLLKFTCAPYSQTLSINCECSRLALMDMQAMLFLYELRPVEREQYTASEAGRPVTGQPPRSPTPTRDALVTPMKRGGTYKWTGRTLPFERKDVWDFVWSQDNPELFAVMEKNKNVHFPRFGPRRENFELWISLSIQEPQDQSSDA